MIVEAAGFGVVAPEEPAKVGPDSVLRLSDELELTVYSQRSVRVFDSYRLV